MPSDNQFEPVVDNDQLNELFNTAQKLNEGDIVEFSSEFSPLPVFSVEVMENIVMVNFVDPEGGEPTDYDHPIRCMDIAVEDKTGMYDATANINDWVVPETGNVTSIELEDEDENGKKRAIVDFELNEN